MMQEPQSGPLRSRLVYDGRIVRLSIDTARMPDGSTAELEMIRHSGAAGVLPVLGDPAGPDPQILLIRQYRYAVGGPLLEIPAGRPARPGETWETCARRELREETGLIAETLTPLTTIFTTPGFTDEQIHLFMATGLSNGASAPDRDEFIEPATMPLSRALDLIRDGGIRDAKTICAILYAAGYRMGH